MIKIDLTDEQIKSLAPLENKEIKAHEDFEPGSMVAQVFTNFGYAEVHFIDRDTAEKIKGILRKNGYVRKSL